MKRRKKAVIRRTRYEEEEGEAIYFLMVYLTTLLTYIKVTGFGVTSSAIQRLAGEPEKDYDNTGQNSRSPGQDVNSGPPKQEVRLIPTEEQVNKFKKEQDKKLKGKNIKMKKRGSWLKKKIVDYRGFEINFGATCLKIATQTERR